MKTILIAHNYSENSFATMSYNLSHHLANEGYKVIFISYRPYFIVEQIIKKEKGKIVVYSWPTKKRPTSIKDFWWFSKIYLKHKPEIIISHFAGGNITNVVSRILSFGKAKTIVYYHTLFDQLVNDNNRNSLKLPLLRYRKIFFYHFFCNHVICPSFMAKKDLSEHFYVDKGVVVLNPINDRFKNTEVISNQNIIISYLGRLDASKGVIDLIKAFKIYKEKAPNTKIRIKMAGAGKEKEEIIKRISDDSSISYFGELSYDKVDDYLSSSHFTIIPSKFDNLPTVGIESLMNKVPLLISSTTGLTEYLTDGEDCFMFEPNVEALIHTFGRVEANFNLHQKMSNNARETYEKKFTIFNYCHEMMELINY